MQQTNISESLLLAAVKKRPKLKVGTHERNNYSHHVTSRPRLPAIDTYEDQVLNRLLQAEYLTDHLLSQYGGQAREVALQNYVWSNNSKDDPRLIDKLIAARNQEHSERAEINALQLRDLVSQRDHLLEHGKRVRQHRQQQRAPPSHSFTLSGRPPDGASLWGVEEGPSSSARVDPSHSVHGVDSFIRYTNDRLPAELARYHRHREQVAHDYERLHKPYSGELGPQSYEEWQMPHYHLVRGLVDDLVNQFLDSHFRVLPPAINRDTAHAVMASENEIWTRQRDAMIEARNVQLVMEEILLEGTRECAHDAAKEFLSIHDYVKNNSSLMLMRSVESVAMDTEDFRLDTDPAYHLVTKSFFNLHRDRHQYKSNVWSHSQHLHLRGQDQQQETNEPDDPDTEVLCFHDIVPMALRQTGPKQTDSHATTVRKESYLRYCKAELQYWKSFTASVSTIPVSSSSRGVYSLVVSPNHKMVAMGTVHGDILVYSLHGAPYRPLRAIRNRNKGNDTVVDLSWSLDGRFLISTNQMGQVQVWSLSPGGIDRIDLKALDLPADDQRMQVSQLSQLVVLDTDHLDLQFQSGPLSDLQIHAENYGPTLAAFFPSLTLLGSQNIVSIALDNGDVIRCDLEEKIIGPMQNTPNRQQSRAATRPTSTVSKAGTVYDEPGRSENTEQKGTLNDGSGGKKRPPVSEPSQMDTADDFDDGEPMEVTKIHLPKIYPPGGASSTVGQGIPAELFRCHKHPIILLGFLDNMDDMTTVDQKGFINVWKYRRKELSNLEWFVPYKKLKLDMSKLMYTTTTNIKPNIIFTDRKRSAGKKERTRQELAQGRQETEKKLDSIGLGDPWHEENIPNQKLFTRIFPPGGTVPESGSMFHVVLRHSDTGLLSTYLTRVYCPLKVYASRLIACKQSILGNALHFLLLFPHYPPKDAHLTLVTLDLHTFELIDLRNDIPIEDAALYEDCLNKDVVSCEVSPPLGMTGSSYIFININGDLSAYSLLTGAKVLAVKDPRRAKTFQFPGCIISSKALDVTALTQISVTSTDNKLLLMAYNSDQNQKQKYLNQVTVVELTDSSDRDQRTAMSKARELWKAHPPHAPVTKRLDPVDFTIEDQHPEAFMQRILVEIIDDIIEDKHESYSAEELLDLEEIDRVMFYKTLLPKVFKDADPTDFDNFAAALPSRMSTLPLT